MAEGMFNYTDPRLLQDAYVQDHSVDARTMAQLPLLNQVAAFGGNTGAQIGTSLGRLFGGKAPMEAEQELIKNVFTQAAKTTTDPMERMKVAAQGFREIGMEGRAMQLEEQMAKMGEMQARTSKARAEEQATLRKQQQEEQLRAALQELPEDATPEQYLSIVRKFGSPDKVMTSIQTSMDKEAQRKATLEAKQAEIQARLEIARQQGADRLQLAQMQIEGRKEIAALAAALKSSNKPEKVLPASLQKSEDADFEAIETVSGLNQSLEPVINSLGGFGDKPVNPELNLGATNNALNTARNFFGMSTPESRQYSQLEETKIRIINDSLRLNKGTQTEGDAQRAAREVEAAWAKNDTEATRQALLRLYKINERAKKNKETQIERRRAAQGVSSGSSKPAKEDPLGIR